MKTALLLSGGMDSTAIAYWRRPDVAVTIDYGQVPAEAEKLASSAVADELGIEHVLLDFSTLSVLGSGDLAGRPKLSVAPKSEWWPYRNQLLVTLAAASLLPLGVETLLIGTLGTDGHHADGKAEFVARLSALLEMQEGNMRLEAPAIDLNAPDLIRTCGIPLELLAWAHSCHRSNVACGDCSGCNKHYRTLETLGESPY